MSLSLGVVIPTYRRPDWIGRAHRSLVVQGAPPEQIVIVCREGDDATVRAAHQAAASSPVPTRIETVSEPGHIPPVRRGARSLEGEVDLIALIDDDAEVVAGWAALARSHFAARPALAALAGRVDNYWPDGRYYERPVVDEISYVDWRGRIVGKLHCDPREGGERPVHLFMAGNCCLRSSIWSALELDSRLNHDVAFHYELDLSLQVRNLGGEILYDPEFAIKHYQAPRELDGMRTDGDAALRWKSYNLTRIYARRERGVRRARLVLDEVLIGSRRTPGLWTVAPLTVVERSIAPLRRFAASTRGRAAALLELAQGR